MRLKRQLNEYSFQPALTISFKGKHMNVEVRTVRGKKLGKHSFKELPKVDSIVRVRGSDFKVSAHSPLGDRIYVTPITRFGKGWRDLDTVNK